MTTRLGRIETVTDPKPASSDLTAEETDRLRGFARSDGWWNSLQSAVTGGGCLGLLVFFVTFTLWRWLAPVYYPARHEGYFQALGLVAGLCVAIAILRSDSIGWAQAKSRSADLQRDASQGFAHVLEFDIVRAVEIEEYEDEGAGFFLELTDGRVLCLISQDLYDYASDIDIEEGEVDFRGKFPQTRIRYRYAPLSGTCLDLAGIGESLRTLGKVKTTGRFSKRDKTSGRGLHRPGGWDDLRRSARRNPACVPLQAQADVNLASPEKPHFFRRLRSTAVQPDFDMTRSIDRRLAPGNGNVRAARLFFRKRVSR